MANNNIFKIRPYKSTNGKLYIYCPQVIAHTVTMAFFGIIFGIVLAIINGNLSLIPQMTALSVLTSIPHRIARRLPILPLINMKQALKLIS